MDGDSTSDQPRKRKKRRSNRKLEWPDVRKRVLKELRGGASRRYALAVVGASPNEIKRECERDQDFAREVEEALLKGRSSLRRIVRKAAKNDPKWAAWLLERLDSDYIRRDEGGDVSVNVNVGIELTVEQRRTELLGIIDSIRERGRIGTHPGVIDGASSNGHSNGHTNGHTTPILPNGTGGNHVGNGTKDSPAPSHPRRRTRRGSNGNGKADHGDDATPAR